MTINPRALSLSMLLMVLEGSYRDILTGEHSIEIRNHHRDLHASLFKYFDSPDSKEVDDHLSLIEHDITIYRESLERFHTLTLENDKEMQGNLSLSSTHDRKCRTIVTENPNMLIPWFLMACEAYEHQNTSIISDGTFDWLSSRLAENWDDIDHQHKHLIAMDDPLQFKGSSVCVDWDNFPDRIRGATQALIRQLN